MGVESVVGARVELAKHHTRVARDAGVQDTVRVAAAAAGLGEYQFTLRPAGWRTATALAAGALVCVVAVMAWADASWVLRLLLAWVLVGVVIGAVAAVASCNRRTWHFFEEGAVVTRRGRAPSIRMLAADTPG